MKVNKVLAILLGALVVLSPGVALSSVERAASSAQVGPAKAGIAVAVIAPEKSARLGQKIPIQIEIRNLTSSTMYYGGVSAGFMFNFVVTDQATGKQLPTMIPGSGLVSHAAGLTQLNVGKSVYRDFELTDYVKFSQPGTYSLTVTMPSFAIGNPPILNPMTSNSIVITITK